MSHAAPRLLRPTALRPHAGTSQDKRAIVISMASFFAAIGVVGWFGLSGLSLGNGPESEPGVPRVIFAGGAPQQPTVEEVRSAAPATDEESDYVIGDFGDPVDELYAEADDGGWGEAALEMSKATSRNAT